MDDKNLVEEIKKELVDSSIKKIDEAIEKKLADIQSKMVFGKNTKDSEIEEKQKAVEYIKAKYFNDTLKLKTLSPNTSGYGQELVPTYLANEIIRVAGEYGVVRRLSRLWPMNLRQDIATMGSVIAQRKTPTGSAYVSTPTTGKAVSLVAETIASIIPFSAMYLKEPNFNIVSLLAELAGEAIAKKEDEWGLLGDTTGEGIFKNNSVPSVVLGTGKTHYSDITADNLLEAVSLLKGTARKNARWVMSWSVFNAIRGLKDTNGRYIVQAPSEGAPATIWNFPVEFSDVMPETSETNQADKYFIVLGDFRYMVLGQTKGLEMDISKEATINDGTNNIHLFQDDLVAVRFTEYIDIEIAEPSKAFVKIKTAAS